VKPAAEIEDKYVTVAQFQEFAAMVKDSLSAVVKPVNELKANFDSELVNIKNQIKGKHTPPTQRVNEGGLSPAEQYLKRK